QATEEGHDLFEVEAVPGSNDRVSWFIDFEQPEAAAGSEHPREFSQHGRDRGEVPQGEPGDRDRHAAVAKWQAEGIGLYELDGRQPACKGAAKHLAREVQSDDVAGFEPG